MDLSPIILGASEIFTANFQGQLAAGETIISASWEPVLLSGTDSNPSAMISGASTISGNLVSQMIAPTVAGNYYRLVAFATTSLGQKIPRYANVMVEAPSAAP
ncbi:MAG: hypothetical protein KGL39_11205 [Patescibacteria group bacterium]|nr:hypothetical protein [Patescibacteria group bacterium]